MTGPVDFHATSPVRAVDELLGLVGMSGRAITVATQGRPGGGTSLLLSETIAAVVLDAADVVVDFKGPGVPLPLWERADSAYREHVLRSMRQELAETLYAKGALAVELPRWVELYAPFRWQLGMEDRLTESRESAIHAAGNADAVNVIVRMLCRARVPDFEREAGVRSMVPDGVKDRLR